MFPRFSLPSKAHADPHAAALLGFRRLVEAITPLVRLGASGKRPAF
jgi:hypothetical protein